MFNFNRKEKGQGLVEYALILVLIAIVVIVAMRVLGNKVSDTFGTVNSELGGSGGGEEAAATDVPAMTSFSCPNTSQYSVQVDIGYMQNVSSFTCSSVGEVHTINWDSVKVSYSLTAGTPYELYERVAGWPVHLSGSVP